MSRRRLILLKLGGSVLRDEARLRLAVHEIYRWHRDGWGVVAVVSALAGRTEELLGLCHRAQSSLSGHSIAAVLSGGEQESASRLGLHLDVVGVSARVLTPGSVGLIATGDPRDAEPVAVDTEPILAGLEDVGVVVFPGFLALDPQGRPVTLGRGGSDLTALFLAQHLGADRCRLVKDVDGLYTADPATSPHPVERYASIHYEDALRLDGTIVQHKAIRHAQRWGLAFEVGGFNGTRPTQVGGEASRLDPAPRRHEPLEVSVVGVGTVGGGVVEELLRMPEFFRLVGACCRHPERLAEHAAQGVLVTDDATQAAGRGGAVVELMGGVGQALSVARLVLASGRHLVTANKALIARHGPELRSIARRTGASFRCSASVGGGLPIIERVTGAPVARIRGVLNGTANYVLERVRGGLGFAEAVATAQALGLAEADPSRDLDGRDSLDKLLVLAQLAGFADPEPWASRVGLDAAAASHTDPRTRLRQVAVLDGGGARVRVEPVVEGDPLYDLPGEGNACEIETTDGRREILRGRGAGRWPTAESVLSDLLELAREATVRREEEALV